MYRWSTINNPILSVKCSVSAPAPRWETGTPSRFNDLRRQIPCLGSGDERREVYRQLGCGAFGLEAGSLPAEGRVWNQLRKKDGRDE